MPEKIVAAGGLVFNEKKQLLMIFRREKWDLPKGKLDKGEKIEDCALREVEEETGLKKLVLKNFAGLTYHEYFDKYSNKNVTKETHWYEMFAPGDQPLTPQTEEDIQEIEWVDEKHIREKLNNTYPNIIEIVEKVKG